MARLQATSVGQVISVRNDSDGTIWTEVALVLDDTWRYEKRRTIRAGDTVTPPRRGLPQGRPAAARQLQAPKLTIQCEQGRVSLPLVEKR